MTSGTTMIPHIAPSATSPDTADPETAFHPTPAKRRGMDPVPLLFILCFAILLGALGWLYEQPRLTHVPKSVSLSARLDALEHQQARIERAPAALAALEQRVAVLEARPVAPPIPPASATMASAPAVISAAPDAGLAIQLAALAARVQALETGLADHMPELQRQIVAAREAGEQVRAMAQQASRLAQLQRAAAALQAGRPLGLLPGAAPALQRFATVTPPTEASLRLRFPAVAREARALGTPEQVDAGVLQRLAQVVQRLFTISRNGSVIVGDPAAGLLITAQERLDAGDLAGAVDALHPLQGAAAAAVAPWRNSAQAVLDARAALIEAEQRG